MFWDVFVEQSYMRGLSPNAVAKELGIPSGSITAWKNGAIPRRKTLVMLSNFFGISVDDFFKKQKPAEIGEPKSDLDVKFNEIWDTFSDEEKKATIEFMKMFKK